MNKEKLLELKNMLLEEIKKEQEEQIKILKQVNLILSLFTVGLIFVFLILRNNL